MLIKRLLFNGCLNSQRRMSSSHRVLTILYFVIYKNDFYTTVDQRNCGNKTLKVAYVRSIRQADIHRKQLSLCQICTHTDFQPRCSVSGLPAETQRYNWWSLQRECVFKYICVRVLSFPLLLFCTLPLLTPVPGRVRPTFSSTWYMRSCSRAVEFLLKSV